jgi:1,4-dihydroxy-2-naphthoate octaprenyltransferase
VILLEGSMPNIAMWGRALTVMPRISKPDWDGLDLVSRWLIATRSAVLVMTLTSAAFGGLLAASAGTFEAFPFALAAVGLCLAHATNNLINDLTDHWKGVDVDDYFRRLYGPQTVADGYLSAGRLVAYAAATGAAALAIGVELVMLRGEVVVWLVAAGAFFVLFYTWPLKYIGLGEPSVLLVWGPLMVGGTYYVTTGTWSNPVAFASLAYALGPTAVLFGKHIDKLEADRGKGIRTVPVLIGERASRVFVVALLVAQYAVVIGLVVTGFFGPAPLVCLLAMPYLRQLIAVYREPRPEHAPPTLPEGVWPLYFVAAAFAYQRRFGALLLLGLLIDLAWKQLWPLLVA